MNSIKEAIFLKENQCSINVCKPHHIKSKKKLRIDIFTLETIETDV